MHCCNKPCQAKQRLTDCAAPRKGRRGSGGVRRRRPQRWLHFCRQGPRLAIAAPHPLKAVRARPAAKGQQQRGARLAHRSCLRTLARVDG